MKGTLTVQSTHGLGSAFTFTMRAFEKPKMQRLRVTKKRKVSQLRSSLDAIREQSEASTPSSRERNRELEEIEISPIQQIQEAEGNIISFQGNMIIADMA